MSAKTSIEWTDHTFNPWWGCAKVSPGCANCYAERDAKRYGHKVWGADAPRRFFGDKHWREPLRWDIAAMKAGVRRRVFCASMADVFEETGNPGVDFRLDAERRKLYRVIQYTPHLDWLLLTKRPENIRRLAPASGWPPSVRVGTSIENQETAEARIYELLCAGAPHPWLSYEPALAPVNLRRVDQVLGDGQVEVFSTVPLATARNIDALEGFTLNGVHRRIEWVIVGGESGPGARPFALLWARSMLQQCRAPGVAVFMKQLGAIPILYGGENSGLMRIERYEEHGCPHIYRALLHDRKGGDPSEWPEDLRVREFPR